MFFVWTYVAHGYRFPVGPDAPVYLWWTRLAGLDGLSAVGGRPGVPALALAVGGALHLPPAAVIAGLECALGVGVGMGAVALVRSGPGDASRAAWILAGVLTGTFAVHLATGYLANLVFGVLFLGAAAALARGTARGAAAAAALLGAGGFAHPQFYLLGLVVLCVTALLSWRADERREVAHVAGAAAGAGVLLGIGLLAILPGPSMPNVDTSRDAFLRRAGLNDILVSAYRKRFLQHWARYVQWASIPLAIGGLRDATGFVGRFLRAWGIVTIAGVALALSTGVVPPDRFDAFGYLVPILAAFGLVRLWRWLAERRRALAWGIAGSLLLAMVLGAAFTWGRQKPFLTPREAERVTDAGRYIAATPSGTPLVFFVETGDPSITFFATQAANAIRASVPPDRIRDVYVVVRRGGQGNDAAAIERNELARRYRAEAAAAVRRIGGRALTLDIGPFDRPDFGQGPAPHSVGEGVIIYGDLPEPVAYPGDPLLPSSPGRIVLASVALLALFAVVGYGWARTALGSGIVSTALAPAFGAAAIVILVIAADAAGLSLSGSIVPTVASAVAGGSGYLSLLLQRRTLPDPAPEV